MASAAGTSKRKGAASATGAGGDGRPLTPQDNQPPKEASIEEAERAQLISIVSQAVAAKGKIAEAKAVVKSLMDGYTSLMRTAKGMNPLFERWLLDELVDDMTSGSRDQVDRERVRRRMREHLGLPTGATQMELFGSDKTPEAAKDEQTWRSEGYLAYFQEKPCDPKAADVPPRFHQVWMEGWHDGQKTTAWAMGVVKDGQQPAAPAAPAPAAQKAEPKAAASKAKPAAPGGDGRPSRLAGYEIQRTEDGERWEPIDPDDMTFGKDGGYDTEAEAWAACDADHVARLRKEGNNARADEIEAQRSQGDDFEATPEELAAQKPRQIVQEQRAAAETEEPV